jgi:L-asparaginase
VLQALREATRNGKLVINISQCMQGMVEMGRYDTGYQLQEAGVISGYDSTVESAVTKLMFLQSHYQDPEQVREQMRQSIRGEISVN